MVYHTAIPRKWIQALILNKSRKTSMVMHSPLYTHSMKNKKTVTKKIKNKKQRITPPPPQQSTRTGIYCLWEETSFDDFKTITPLLVTNRIVNL